MKKIVFFDADGTLWYPKATKYSEHPIWVYRKYSDPELCRKEFVLVPEVVETLKNLKDKGILLVVLSTNPKEPEEANAQMKDSVRYHSIHHLFDEVHATRPYFESKAEFILSILKKYKIPKKYALMVGDSYEWDYHPAVNAGIDAVLIDNNYPNRHKNHKKVKRKINLFSEVLKYIKI